MPMLRKRLEVTGALGERRHLNSLEQPSVLPRTPIVTEDR